MPAFERLRFTFIGDGPLFEQTLAPISNLPNVRIRREFLTQANITGEHKRHGVFLVPTRLDTQGVSRDEAMSSGLVPVTNAIPVVREFVDQETAGLAAPDDSLGLADEIWRMVEDPDLYLRRSAAAAERVRRERGHGKIIPMELTLLAEALVYA
jgi:glycosyltransferase involved in cell wall biosynthesis